MATAMRVAVIGAGPAGLVLALQASQAWPHAQITLYDARAADRDVSADPRTLALAAGSIALLRRLGGWPAEAAEPIVEVHVSQVPATAVPWLRDREVRLRASELGVPALGAVLAYGPLVAALQRRWQAAAAAEPQRWVSRFGTPVARVESRPDAGGVDVEAGDVARYDLAVIAEGGVFADQARKAVTHDYRQTAWVGTVTLEGGARGLAVERFTRDGPLALLPLRDDAGGTRRAAIVWCVASEADPVPVLDDAQRLAVINALLPAAAGRVTGLAPLKSFALGLNAERTLVEGRIVRIGNAAQTLHPVAGQGLNLGLRDAYALVAALRFRSDDIDRALRGVEWQRAPDRWSMIAATDLLARSFTWQAPGVAAVRALALAGLSAAPPLRQLLARRMMYGRR